MKRKSISKKIQLAVWVRDCWTCRYCLNPVFFGPALKLLNEISSGHCYYHANGKQGKMLPLFQCSWASVDHVIPFSKRGEDSMENFVTACWKCNLAHNDTEYEKGKPNPKKIPSNIVNLNWDGFSSLYVKLSEKENDWIRQIEKVTKPTKSSATKSTDAERK